MKNTQLVATSGVMAATDANPLFLREVLTAVSRFKKRDWGDMSDGDKQLNDEAMITGDRLLAAYNTTQGKIYIITEWEIATTTILFAEEY